MMDVTSDEFYEPDYDRYNPPAYEVDEEADREAEDVVDRLMTDEKFYDDIVGWF